MEAFPGYKGSSLNILRLRGDLLQETITSLYSPMRNGTNYKILLLVLRYNSQLSIMHGSLITFRSHIDNICVEQHPSALQNLHDQVTSE